MSDLAVERIVAGRPVRVGTIMRPSGEYPSFSYAESYLSDAAATPLSQSLPLSADPVGESGFRAYFEGLVPEGAARDALVARLQVREDDYLSILATDGLDCIGDVAVRDEDIPLEWGAGSYEELGECDLTKVCEGPDSLASSNDASRLSLAGTQGKVGLAHLPGEPIGRGWLRPIGGAASTHILKVSNIPRIAEFELVCMGAARRCGLRVAGTAALHAGRPVCASERFDRVVRRDGDSLVVERLHQEDMAQAFGISPRAKYLELDGGSYYRVARLILENSESALADLDQLARIAVFGYLVGNCDNHLKNLAVVYRGRFLRLAPAYDLVCTTFFERFSRDMGMRLGSTRAIDEVTPDDFALLAHDLGLGRRRMRTICSELAEGVVPALIAAGDDFADALPSLPYSAEDVVDDLAQRREVVRRAGSGTP